MLLASWVNRWNAKAHGIIDDNDLFCRLAVLLLAGV